MTHSGHLSVPLPAVQKPLATLQQVAATLPEVTGDADVQHAEIWAAVAALEARIEALEQGEQAP